MPAEDKILTLHPDGKKGKNIIRGKYDTMRDCILDIFSAQPEIGHRELTKLSNELLAGKFEGNISWYMETVLLDLIARGLIRRISEKPVRLGVVVKQV